MSFKSLRENGSLGKTAKRLFRYITSQYRARLILVVALILTNALVNVANSLFIRSLIDNYIMPLTQQQNPVFAGLLKAIAGMACVFLVGVASGFAYQRLMASISQGVLRRIRDDMFAHMQTLPISYFDTHTFGEVMSHYTNDTDTLRQMISQSMPQALSSLVSITSVFCTMLVLSPLLILVVIAGLVLKVFVVGKIGSKSASYFMHQQVSLAKINGFIEEMVSGQRVVKVFNHEGEAKKQFDERNEVLYGDAVQANQFANILMPIMGNLGHLQYAILAVAGGACAIAGVGGVTLGLIASFLQLSRGIDMPINQISQQLNAIVMALAGAERIFKLLDEQPERDDGAVTLVRVERAEDGTLHESAQHTGLWAWKRADGDGSVQYTQLLGDVRLEGVDFFYEADKPVLNRVSFYAKPGQKIAFVGATGAGKTTITNLINRFYDVEQGRILYDGIDVKDIKKADLRRSLGVVLQDVNLFTATVRENIRYGNMDATDEQIEWAAKLANAHDFIMRLPKGYDTVLEGDGSGLSQGQRQLISIARAAVADPPVMILDEATSSIDTRTEVIVQRGMDALMTGRTVFVIAHRLSTVQNANAIIVLDRGDIIERGDHDDLLEQRGKYFQLYTGATA